MLHWQESPLIIHSVLSFLIFAELTWPHWSLNHCHICCNDIVSLWSFGLIILIFAALVRLWILSFINHLLQSVITSITCETSAAVGTDRCILGSLYMKSPYMFLWGDDWFQCHCSEVIWWDGASYLEEFVKQCRFSISCARRLLFWLGTLNSVFLCFSKLHSYAWSQLYVEICRGKMSPSWIDCTTMNSLNIC